MPGHPGPCLSQRSEARPSCCNFPSSSMWQQFPRGFESRTVTHEDWVHLGTVRQSWARCSLCISLCQWESISDQVVPLKHASRIIGYNWHHLASIGLRNRPPYPECDSECPARLSSWVLLAGHVLPEFDGRLSRTTAGACVKACQGIACRKTQTITTYHNVSQRITTTW